MKITFRRCTICSQFHNHLSCPYCGALQVSQTRTVHVQSGRMMARGLPLPRMWDNPITITRINVQHGNITSRIAR